MSIIWNGEQKVGSYLSCVSLWDFGFSWVGTFSFLGFDNRDKKTVYEMNVCLSYRPHTIAKAMHYRTPLERTSDRALG